MSDLRALFEAIGRLPPDELEKVRDHIQQRRLELDQVRRSNEDVEERIAGIREALAEFREGLSERELNDIVAAIRDGNKVAGD